MDISHGMIGIKGSITHEERSWIPRIKTRNVAFLILYHLARYWSSFLTKYLKTDVYCIFAV